MHLRAGVVGLARGDWSSWRPWGAARIDRYTVKRYRSEKTQLPDGTWTHDRIPLEPLNPDYEAWDLDPEEERYRIFAEFVDVLD